MDKNCLSFWYPILKECGISQPRTEIVRTDCNLSLLLDGNFPEGYLQFIRKLKDTALFLSLPPWFLRTGHTSGKHRWEHCCFVDNSIHMASHVVSLVEFSALADFLPTDVWAIRELLPTDPICFLPAYDSMPLVPEVRVFVENGSICCRHPYWPADSIRGGFPFKSDPNNPYAMNRERDLPHNIDYIIEKATILSSCVNREVDIIASQVAIAMASHGAFSIDFLPTEDGWYVTDLAEAGKSFHWTGCPNEKRWKR